MERRHGQGEKNRSYGEGELSGRGPLTVNPQSHRLHNCRSVRAPGRGLGAGDNGTLWNSCDRAEGCRFKLWVGLLQAGDGL